MSSITRQVVLVALLLAAVLGLFVAAESGQRRLEEASRHVQHAAQRQGALADVWQLVRQAESSQRGYILTDSPTYLMPFQEASGNLPQALSRLQQAFATATPAVRADVAEVENLVNAKFAEMRDTLEAYRTRGRAAALELMRTDVGVLTMRRIDDRVRSIDQSETANILLASDCRCVESSDSSSVRCSTSCSSSAWRCASSLASRSLKRSCRITSRLRSRTRPTVAASAALVVARLTQRRVCQDSLANRMLAVSDLSMLRTRSSMRRIVSTPTSVRMSSSAAARPRVR